MEIYIKTPEGQLQETTLFNVLTVAFRNAGLEMDNGSFSGENHRWLGIVQESKKSSQVVTNITFENNGNVITGLNVYETPIKRVVDDDNSRQVV